MRFASSHNENCWFWTTLTSVWCVLPSSRCENVTNVTLHLWHSFYSLMTRFQADFFRDTYCDTLPTVSQCFKKVSFCTNMNFHAKNHHRIIINFKRKNENNETFLRWFSTTLTYVVSFQKNIRIEAGRMPSCFLFRVKIVLDHYGIGHVQRLRKMVAVGAPRGQLCLLNTGL